MVGKLWALLFMSLLLLMSSTKFARGKLSLSGTLRSVGRKVMSMDLDSINAAQVGPQFGGYAIGGGLIAFRSSIISSMSQLDRGEKEAAMESYRVAIASLTLETTQTFGLPIISVVMDKVINKYGSKFPKTVKGFASYNQMLGDAILHQAADVGAPIALADGADEVVDALGTLKARISTDFGEEAASLLKSSQGFEDLVKPLKNAKSWAKAAKWGDFLLGPLFDAANIAFTGWQLHSAIQSGDQLAIASGSIGIASSIVGIGAFVVGSLATAGSVLAATAGPVGAIVGCVLSLAALIIDVINSYNPTQKINEHLALVRSLTTASKDVLADLHQGIIKNATADGVEAGFNTLYEVNQAMLVKASISNHWDTIKGMMSENHEKVEFKPEMVKKEGDLLVVGDMRVFDKKHYQNWAFKPEGREEIGYNYYGKVIKEEEGGICVRLDTEMVTNAETNMWFWLNGARVTTYAEGEEERVADDNIQVGDFRTLLTTSDRYVDINTGGGNDLVQITGIVCSEEQQKLLRGKCLFARMGSGYDTISFEGMDTRKEKVKWFLKHDNLDKTKVVVGISFDMGIGWISYRLRDHRKSIKDAKFAGTSDVERFIGSPLDDVVKFDDAKNYVIKQSFGRNIYKLKIDRNGDGRQYVIEDNSDTPGTLYIKKVNLGWKQVIFSQSTNVIVLLLGTNKTAQIFLKRCKPGLEHFKIVVNSGRPKKLSQITSTNELQDIVLPFVFNPYKFDRNLLTAINQPTYIELLVPTDDYPKSANYDISLTYAHSILSLSEELLDTLRDNVYELIARRIGPRGSSSSWYILLKKPGRRGGWRINVGQSVSFAVGMPGSFQYICNLATQERSEVNIFSEYRSILEEQVFDSTQSIYGTSNPDKLSLVYPKDLSKREKADTYLIDLKGPDKPTDANRNELVVSDNLIYMLFRYDMAMYMDMTLERASKQDDWHLKIYSDWGSRILGIDATLKGVHTIITGEQHGWKQLVNLYDSEELKYDLERLVRYAYNSS